MEILLKGDTAKIHDIDKRDTKLLESELLVD
jgi:hypothetical protein